VPEFGPELNDYVSGVFHHTQPDGTYRLVALPGPGIVTVAQTPGTYLTGVGYDALKCPRRGTDGTIEAIGPSISPSFGMPNTMREFDIPEGADSFEQDLQLDPGQTIELRVVDPEGRPLKNVSVATFRRNSTKRQLYSENPFRLANFAPGEVRGVLIETAGLGVLTTIDSGKTDSESVEIQLRPTATLKGQLFHEDGTPLAEADLSTDLQPFNSLATNRSAMQTDRNGHFEIPIHADVAVNVRVVLSGINGSVARQLSLKSGEVKDLGALQIADGRFQSAKSSE